MDRRRARNFELDEHVVNLYDRLEFEHLVLNDFEFDDKFDNLHHDDVYNDDFDDEHDGACELHVNNLGQHIYNCGEHFNIRSSILDNRSNNVNDGAKPEATYCHSGRTNHGSRVDNNDNSVNDLRTVYNYSSAIIHRFTLDNRSIINDHCRLTDNGCSLDECGKRDDRRDAHQANCHGEHDSLDWI